MFLETFVETDRFTGASYMAANWICVVCFTGAEGRVGIDLWFNPVLFAVAWIRASKTVELQTSLLTDYSNPFSQRGSRRFESAHLHQLVELDSREARLQRTRTELFASYRQLPRTPFRLPRIPCHRFTDAHVAERFRVK